MKSFKLPRKSNLRTRISTIANAFAISITPWIAPTESEIKNMYNELDIKENQCAYCLREAKTVDHIYPLVSNGMPTGYITDIHNLVPCCSNCNSRKGGKDFSIWFLSKNNIEILKRIGLNENQISDRYERIKKYAKNIPSPLNYKEIVGEDLWNKYISLKLQINEELKKSQKFCDELRQLITKKI